MAFLKILASIQDALSRVGFALAACVLAFISAAYCYEVISRYFFNAPTIWASPLVFDRRVVDRDSPIGGRPSGQADLCGFRGCVHLCEFGRCVYSRHGISPVTIQPEQNVPRNWTMVSAIPWSNCFAPSPLA